MARQPFRRTKSDGTIDDGTGGGGGTPGYKTVDLDATHNNSFHKTYGAFGVDGQSTGYTMNFFGGNNQWSGYPFVMPKDGTLDSIVVQVSTAASDSGDEIAVAIYPSDANGNPEGEDAIVLKTDVDVTTTGYKTIDAVANATVTGGDIYWWACCPKLTTWPGTLKMKTSIGGKPNLSGKITGGSSNTSPFSGVSRWGTFSGDPPSTFATNGLQYKVGSPTGRYVLFNLTYT